MLINKQTITAICDVCGFEQITYNEVILEGNLFLVPSLPNGWYRIADFVICPKHHTVTVRNIDGEVVVLEDNNWC